MQFFTLCSIVLGSSLTASLAMPAIRARAENELQVTFWVAGCANNDCGVVGCSQTYRYAENVAENEIGFNKPGDCIGAPNYRYQALDVLSLEDEVWSVDLFSGEGCNNFVRVRVPNWKVNRS